MRRLKALLGATILLLLGSLMVAPAVSAAVPILDHEQLVAYDDHQQEPIRLYHKASDEIYRTIISSPSASSYGCTTTGRSVSLPFSLRGSISAILLYVPRGSTTCNYVWVTNVNGQRYGECVNRYDWGFNFGPDYNDRTISIGAKRNTACPPW